MRKTIVAFFLCLATMLAVAQPAGPGAAAKPAPAASQAEEGSSTAQEIGRVIGALLKRATNVLREVASGISEGFKSTPSDSPPEAKCSAEEARKGNCQPARAHGESSVAENPPPASSGFLIALLKALF